MEESKAKSHAVKKMTRKGLVETDSREGMVKEIAEAKSDGRRINQSCGLGRTYGISVGYNDWRPTTNPDRL